MEISTILYAVAVIGLLNFVWKIVRPIGDNRIELDIDTYYDFIECNNYYTMCEMHWTDKAKNSRIAEKVKWLPDELAVQLGRISSVDIPNNYKVKRK